MWFEPTKQKLESENNYVKVLTLETKDAKSSEGKWKINVIYGNEDLT